MAYREVIKINVSRDGPNITIERKPENSLEWDPANSPSDWERDYEDPLSRAQKEKRPATPPPSPEEDWEINSNTSRDSTGYTKKDNN